MKKRWMCLFILMAMCACHQPARHESNALDSLPPASVDKSEEKPVDKEAARFAGLDSVMAYYIGKTDNEMLSLARNDSSKLEWYIDRLDKQYIVAPVGITVTEPDGSSPRFNTMMWLHVDSATMEIYEYDLPNDTLIKWGY
ncbi:hypothetical protein [uncultured Chitinophaga sp.]|uniref:hypothetical protein n=1 Tax=uncultured Chitinophaga sp. TaxID=339340 RepID=UPI0025DF5E63|nr:hypothetical protein [uncultured Chitinophaga sp.]